MDDNFLTEGVTFGGIRNNEELRILICYIFDKVEELLNLDDILEFVEYTEVANYFECVTAFNDLVKRGNLVLAQNSNKYILTESGYLIVSQLYSKLPKTTRDRVVGVALMIINRRKVKENNHVEVKSAKNSYNVSLTISGEENDLFNFNINMPTHDEAKIVENNILDNPTLIYNVMIAAVTQNKDFIKNALDALDKHI